mgnify:CR=1 FL=1
MAADAPVLIQGGSVPLINWRNSVVVRNPSSLPGVDPTFEVADETEIARSIFQAGFSTSPTVTLWPYATSHPFWSP